ncbi:MAG: aminotransferase class I/II-fold pyridoxal phosphate-dependent enzyme [Oscillospiraceae bacterium]|nr:aminotransferase class I/II-fold pyridoxal phosphate-dependent enzyme [Oscillospiraceae bacterium]
MIPLNDRLQSLQRSGIRRYTNLAKTVPDCVMLTIGEPDFDTPHQIKAAAVEALNQGRTHYAPNQGEESLRRAIAEFETKRGMQCKPEQVLITAGATGALYTALTGILNPGEEVVIPTPAFPLYESITLAAGAVPVFLDIRATGFQLTAEALTSCITEKTKAIVLNSPNNPSGAVLSQASLEAVKAAVAGKDIYIICDNVYQGLSERPCPDLCLDGSLAEKILLCQSFSKPYAMTGWRIGYLVCPETVMDRLLLLHAAELASMPTFLQDACVAALTVNTKPMAEVYARRRELVCRRLKEMGLSFPEPEGAFYVFPDISRFGLTDEAFCTRLIAEGGVATVPGSCFGCPGHIRISCCCAEKQLVLGLDRLAAFLKSL